MANKFTHELLEKAKLAKSAEELIALAKENGTEMTEESAKAYFAQLHKTGELGDDELDSVSGGGKCGTIYNNKRPVITGGNSCEYWRCERCHHSDLRITDDIHDECRSCGNKKMCCRCEYSRYEDALLQCFCPERYDN